MSDTRPMEKTRRAGTYMRARYVFAYRFKASSGGSARTQSDERRKARARVIAQPI
jgi:hypothetical protein